VAIFAAIRDDPWRRFVACVKALPADQAAMVWPAVLAEATALANV
jgi:hypothetical protein